MIKKQLLPFFLLALNIPAFSQLKTGVTGTIKKDQQHRWHPYIGLHVSGDAEMFYLGPSYQVGTDYRLNEKLLLTAYAHYFNKKRNGEVTYDRFRTFTTALLLQLNTGKNRTKSFFVAGGICYQYWHDQYRFDFDDFDKKRRTILPAIRIGHFFPAQKHTIVVEINATGPYWYKEAEGSYVTITEIITQLSLGGRFVF